MALRDLDPEMHLGEPARKQAYVTTLFDTIAPRYDRFTRVFSFGMDARWKRQLAGWAADVIRPGDVVADLACGTGDLGRAVERLSGWVGGRPHGQRTADPEERAEPRLRMIVGLDASANMMRLAGERRRIASSNPFNRSTAQPLIRADMMALPLADASVDVVTVGYGFRNTPDARAALAEVARVLRPGGWLFDLDFFRPEHPTWARIYLGYLRRTGRLVGRWWHDEPEAYGYIARSIQSWLTPRQFDELLQSVGLRVHQVVRHLGGGICLHGARLSKETDRSAFTR